MQEDQITPYLFVVYQNLWLLTYKLISIYNFACKIRFIWSICPFLEIEKKNAAQANHLFKGRSGIFLANVTTINYKKAQSGSVFLLTGRPTNNPFRSDYFYKIT